MAERVALYPSGRCISFLSFSIAQPSRRKGPSSVKESQYRCREWTQPRTDPRTQPFSIRGEYNGTYLAVNKAFQESPQWQCPKAWLSSQSTQQSFHLVRRQVWVPVSCYWRRAPIPIAYALSLKIFPIAAMQLLSGEIAGHLIGIFQPSTVCMWAPWSASQSLIL